MGGGIIEPVKGVVEIRDARSRNGPACLLVLEACPGYSDSLRSGGENSLIVSTIAVGQIYAYIKIIAGGECRYVDVKREAG